VITVVTVATVPAAVATVTCAEEEEKLPKCHVYVTYDSRPSLSVELRVGGS